MNRDEIKEIQEALRTLSFYDAQLYPLHVDTNSRSCLSPFGILL